MTRSLVPVWARSRTRITAWTESGVHPPFVIAFTGHRPDKLGDYGEVNPKRDQLKRALRHKLLSMRAIHPDLVAISGMALGFDQWAAEVCIDLGIPFHAAVPFEGFHLRWPAASQEHFHYLLSKAAKVEYVCDGEYAPWKLQKRNEWMADRGHLIIAAWDGSPSGTRNLIMYVRKVDPQKTVFNLLEN